MVKYETMIDASNAAGRRRREARALLSISGALVAASAMHDGWDEAFSVEHPDRHYEGPPRNEPQVGDIWILHAATHGFRVVARTKHPDGTFALDLVRDARLTKDVIAQLDKPKES